MIAINRLFLSIALGVALGAVGAIIVGYLAAIAIPVEFFTWFDRYSSTGIARFLIAMLMQLFGFGLLAILLGQALGKTKYWLSNCLVSYFSMVSYIMFLSGDGALDTMTSMTIESLAFAIVPLVCLFMSAYLSNKKYNHEIYSALNVSSTLDKKG